MKIERKRVIIPSRYNVPDTPAAGERRVFARQDGLWQINDAGVVSRLSVDNRDPLTIWGMGFNFSGSGTWGGTLNTSQAANFYYSNSAKAINDTASMNVLLGQGKYVLTLLGVRNTDAAILDVKVGGSSIGTIDLYAAALGYNYITSLTFTYGSTGNPSLQFIASSKNASSSAYAMYITSVHLTPVKDSFDGNPT